MIEQIVSAWQAAVPIVAVSTTDQAELALEVVAGINNDTAHVRWDCVQGFKAINKAGVESIGTMMRALRMDEERLSQESPNPMNAFSMMSALGDSTVVHAFNSHRFMSDAIVSQGIANLRDRYKSSGRMLVCYGADFNLPAETRNDLVIIDAPAPEDDWLSSMGRTVVKAMAERDGATIEDEDPRLKAVEDSVPALRGLGRFVAEQTFAMSLRDDATIDPDALWKLKKTAIAQIPGLSLSLGGLAFDSLGGLESIKEFMRLRMSGSDPFNLLIFYDELDKQFSGLGDNTGVSSRMHGQFLTFMEDNGIDGSLFVGPAGSGKTALARAIGPEFRIPTVITNMTGMMTSLVGSSESVQREAFKAILGISRGRAFVAATCNKIDGLPPELKRRFTSGIWMFAMPEEEERSKIWEIHRAAFKIPPEFDLPKDDGWSGAEIRNCCRQAKRTGLNLVETARRYVVPLTQQDPASIEKLYSQANGRWLSASHGGHFVAPALTIALAESVPKGRTFGN